VRQLDAADDQDIHKEIEKFEDEDWNDQVDGVL
jgi:hypothetical protein